MDLTDFDTSFEDPVTNQRLDYLERTMRHLVAGQQRIEASMSAGGPQQAPIAFPPPPQDTARIAHLEQTVASLINNQNHLNQQLQLARKPAPKTKASKTSKQTTSPTKREYATLEELSVVRARLEKLEKSSNDTTILSVRAREVHLNEIGIFLRSFRDEAIETTTTDLRSQLLGCMIILRNIDQPEAAKQHHCVPISRNIAKYLSAVLARLSSDEISERRRAKEDLAGAAKGWGAMVHSDWVLLKKVRIVEYEMAKFEEGEKGVVGVLKEGSLPGGRNPEGRKQGK